MPFQCERRLRIFRCMAKAQLNWSTGHQVALFALRTDAAGLLGGAHIAEAGEWRAERAEESAQGFETSVVAEEGG